MIRIELIELFIDFEELCSYDFFIGIDDDESELISSVTIDKMREFDLQFGSAGPQGLVSVGVTFGIVEILEVIDIGHDVEMRFFALSLFHEVLS